MAMTVKEYLKSIDYSVSVKVLGELKNFRYYIQDDLPDNEDIGIPLVVEENKVKHTFEICDADRTFKVIKLFS